MSPRNRALPQEVVDRIADYALPQTLARPRSRADHQVMCEASRLRTVSRIWRNAVDQVEALDFVGRAAGNLAWQTLCCNVLPPRELPDLLASATRLQLTSYGRRLRRVKAPTGLDTTLSAAWTSRLSSTLANYLAQAPRLTSLDLESIASMTYDLSDSPEDRSSKVVQLLLPVFDVTSLTSLGLSRNNIGGQALSQLPFQHLTKLKVLDLASIALRADEFWTLRVIGLPLEVLELSHNRLWPYIDAWGSVAEPTSPDANEVPLTQVPLEKLSALRYLGLDNTGLRYGDARMRKRLQARTDAAIIADWTHSPWQDSPVNGYIEPEDF